MDTPKWSGQAKQLPERAARSTPARPGGPNLHNIPDLTCQLSDRSGHINTTDMILLLVSSDVLASDYCYETEMKRAMTRHRNKTARVIPIILRPVDWKNESFARLQALSTDGTPVTASRNTDEAFADIAESIRKVVVELRR